jgi:hypothetical protein
VISEAQAYCPARCAKFQECSGAVFALKWATLDACVQECDPVVKEAACDTVCDTSYAADPNVHAECLANCGAKVSLDDCEAVCAKAGSEAARCTAGCAANFSQTCADASSVYHQCLLDLTCERAVILMEFGGSASGVGECTSTSDARDKVC